MYRQRRRRDVMRRNFSSGLVVPRLRAEQTLCDVMVLDKIENVDILSRRLRVTASSQSCNAHAKMQSSFRGVVVVIKLSLAD
jgi:hypothetical protein